MTTNFYYWAYSRNALYWVRYDPKNVIYCPHRQAYDQNDPKIAKKHAQYYSIMIKQNFAYQPYKWAWHRVCIILSQHNTCEPTVSPLIFDLNLKAYGAKFCCHRIHTQSGGSKKIKRIQSATKYANWMRHENRITGRGRSTEVSIHCASYKNKTPNLRV